VLCVLCSAIEAAAAQSLFSRYIAPAGFEAQTLASASIVAAKSAGAAIAEPQSARLSAISKSLSDGLAAAGEVSVRSLLAVACGVSVCSCVSVCARVCAIASVSVCVVERV
jgi:hypothetical protein